MVATEDTASERVGACIADPPQLGLRLRIRGTERDGQILRISSPRCTFGGAPTCTVRLRSPRVRPVHCLILSNSRQTIVRNLSPDNALNNAPFHESPLRVGDRLRLGAIEFEVLPHSQTQPHEHGRLQEPPPAKPLRQESGNLDFVERIERLEQQLATYSGRGGNGDSQPGTDSPTAAGFQQAIEQITQQIADERQRRLVDQQLWETDRQCLNAELAKSAEQLSDLANELAEQQKYRDETEQHHSQISEQLAELAAARNRWTQERDKIISEHRQALEDALRVQQQLEEELADSRTELAEHHGSAESHRKLQAEWEMTREQLEADRRQLHDTLEEHAAQIAQLRAEHEVEQRRWMEERAELESALAHQETTLTEQKGESAEIQEALATERDKLETLLQQEQNARGVSEEQTEQHRAKCETLEGRLNEYESLVTDLREKCCELEAATVSNPPTAKSERFQADLEATLEQERCEHQRERAEWDDERQQLIERLDASVNGGAVQEDRLENESLPDGIAGGHPSTQLWQMPVEAPQEETPSAITQPVVPPSEPSMEPPSEPFLEPASDSFLEAPGDSFLEAPGDSFLEAPSDSFLEPPSGLCEQPASGPFEDQAEAEPEVEVQSAEVPVSTADVLAHLGHATETWRNDDVAGPPEESPRPLEAPADEPPDLSPFQTSPGTSQATTQLAPSEEDDEESIEDYMSRLLQRVSGMPEDAPMSPRRKSAPEALRFPGPTAQAPQARATACETDTGEPQGEFCPRRQAPELSSSLAAMRELANDSTRTAIAQHADRNWSDRAKTRFLIYFMALVMVAVLMFAFASQPAFVGGSGVLGALILGYLGWQTWSERRRLFASLALEVPSDPGNECPHQSLPVEPNDPAFDPSTGTSEPDEDEETDRWMQDVSNESNAWDLQGDLSDDQFNENP